jgi:hypothetical protein
LRPSGTRACLRLSPHPAPERSAARSSADAEITPASAVARISLHSIAWLSEQYRSKILLRAASVTPGQSCVDPLRGDRPIAPDQLHQAQAGMILTACRSEFSMLTRLPGRYWHSPLTLLRRARRSRPVSGRMLHNACGKTPFTKILDCEFGLVAPHIPNARAASDAALNHEPERLSSRLSSGG